MSANRPTYRAANIAADRPAHSTTLFTAYYSAVDPTNWSTHGAAIWSADEFSIELCSHLRAEWTAIKPAIGPAV